MTSVLERLTCLEIAVDELKQQAAPSPSVSLLCAARKTLALLKKFRDDKGPETLADPDFDDYAEVCSSIPMLERAIANIDRNAGAKA